jgi:hypothetical protein
MKDQKTVTPEMLSAAWSAWKSRHGGKLGPGPAFKEAIEAAFAAAPVVEQEPALEEVERLKEENGLTSAQHSLLEWLGEEDMSLYGECKGLDLDVLVGCGLAVVHDDELEGSSYWRTVSLTEAGRAALTGGGNG